MLLRQRQQCCWNGTQGKAGDNANSFFVSLLGGKTHRPALVTDVIISSYMNFNSQNNQSNLTQNIRKNNLYPDLLFFNKLMLLFLIFFKVVKFIFFFL